MAYTRRYITLEGAADKDFTDPEEFTLYCTEADPIKKALGEVKRYWGYIDRRSRRGRHLLIRVKCYPFGVNPGDWDAEDYKAFEDFLEYPFLRISATNFPRLSTLYGASFPLQVDWNNLGSTLNAKEAKNEVTIELQTVYPLP